ncbi:MAG: class II fumarate hydratase [Proteobacteria bacterium]|jgi:fumarate hydratase, class II|nr:class II fumarate hydratase [Pseudomonadota bacterium]
MAEDFRTERDSMGPVDVPLGAYYGASTMRAVRNFPIGSLRFPRRFLEALGMIKSAAAQTNAELALLDDAVAQVIVQAAEEVVAGSLDEHFVVDIFQTGSGTSTNMNANEVIANRATEFLGGERGSKLVHPNDHVNLGQSSNDVIPSTIHLSALMATNEELLPALAELQVALEDKAREFWPIVKTGRTHLQDATPIRLGQEFLGYSGQVERASQRLKLVTQGLAELALGGTAVGTGLNTHEAFAELVCQRLSNRLGHGVYETDNHFQAQSTLDAVVASSGALRNTALSLHKIASDISWLGSGPRSGFGELVLPAVQPGSSIMPGKVNPVIAEALLQVCAQVVGNDATVAFAALRGIFELNTMMPVAGYNLLQSIELLASASSLFASSCIAGLVATEKGPALVENGLALGTALAPVLGYDAAADIAKAAAKSGQTIRQVAKEKTGLTDEELEEILNPLPMTEPGFPGSRK